MSTLTVSEIFGPTFQGEGASLGRRCGFLRLGLCNLTCIWCDTPYTWDWNGLNGHRFDRESELRRVSVEHVLAELLLMQVDMVVVTGGEPLLQQTALVTLVKELAGHGVRVEIETNGTLAPVDGLAEVVTQFNVSLKLGNSGVEKTLRIVPTAVTSFVDCDGQFKFVVTSERCLVEVDELVASFSIPPASVWIMPEGRTPPEVQDRLRSLADSVLWHGYHLSTRLHVEVWGDERGR